MRRQGQPGIKAIILYPMNALAQDQAKRFGRIDRHPPGDQRGDHRRPLCGAGRTGQVRRADVSTRMTRDRLIEDHQVLRKYPPDILLTNYKMLDLLLQRKADASLWAANDPETLQYLVLDEFHAYDGVQLADIACLIRRLLSRLKMEPSSLCPVATSATLGYGSAQAMEELRKLAHTVFGRPFDVDAVVTESRPSLEDFLEPVMDAPLPEAVEEMLPRPQEDAEHYIRRQVKLWFGEELGGRELGERLRSTLGLTFSAGPPPPDRFPGRSWWMGFSGSLPGMRKGIGKGWSGASIPSWPLSPMLRRMTAVPSFPSRFNSGPGRCGDWSGGSGRSPRFAGQTKGCPCHRRNTRRTMVCPTGKTGSARTSPRRSRLPSHVRLLRLRGERLDQRPERRRSPVVDGSEGDQHGLRPFLPQHHSGRGEAYATFLFPESCGAPIGEPTANNI